MKLSGKMYVDCLALPQASKAKWPVSTKNSIINIWQGPDNASRGRIKKAAWVIKEEQCSL